MSLSKIQRQGTSLFVGLMCIIITLSSILLCSLSTLNDRPNIISPILIEDGNLYSENPPPTPLFSIQPFQQPRILFIVDNAKYPDPYKDVPFFDLMTLGLNYNVTYHTSNNSYAYESYDAIVISSSVGEGIDTVGSLINAPIPILTMQPGHYDEFQLGSIYSIKDTSKFYIYNGDHYVSQNLDSKSVFTVYTAEYPVGYIQNYNPMPIGVEINLIAVRADKLGKFYWPSDATWLTLEKGNKNWNLTASPERRAFWGAGWGISLTPNGWENWNRTLSWLLYDDVPGNATIQVDVTDLDNKSVSNARVTLIESNNQSNIWIQNTTSFGYSIFSNIPFGYYNITVEYEDTVNDELQFLEIAGERTHDIEPSLYFSVQIDEYSDNNPPLISNIQFQASNTTFSADIYDESSIITVNLSLTVRNSTSGSILRNTFYYMVSVNNIQYYNDTALEGLPSSGINVVYNISAIDIASNKEVSENKFFTLGDMNAPIIHYYNVTDNEDGSLVFYANVTDEESLVQEVVLRINDTYESMYLNSSGLWIFETYAYYDILLNYSIHKAVDSVGNENNDSFYPKSGLITPKDGVNPIIYDLSYNLSDHEKGFVVFRATVEEINDYQSGVNTSSIMILLSIYNGNWMNDSYPMYAIGAITYEFEYTFSFNDTVFYRIIASDLAGNINLGHEHNDTIDDNSIPELFFDAKEFGNGTVEFNSTVTDWPDNTTSVTLYYTQDYFGSWSNVSMVRIDENLYLQQIPNFDFRLRDVWYYATSIDSALNLFEPTPDQYQKIELSDTIAPDVFFSISNSTIVDGNIFITAWASDPYGDSRDINNSFYINFTQQGVTVNYEMSYESFYFYTFDQTFNFGDEILIEVWTTDSVGNTGLSNRTIIISDYAAPKILDTGIIEYQNGTVTFWAEVLEYSTGSGLPSDNSSVSLEFVFISIYNETMSWNGSGNIYFYTFTGLVPGNAFNYRISAYDTNNNSLTTLWNMEIIEDKSAPIINSFGYSETLVNHTFTRLDFWINAQDVFGPIVGAEITIDYFNGSSWNQIKDEMISNGSDFTYSVCLHCNFTFNYSIQVYDAKPNLVMVSNTNMRTYWGPVVIESGIIQDSDNTIIIWANISDWGSGVTEVILEYHFDSQEGLGGGGAQVLKKTVQMEFNGSLYIATLSFQESGALTWTIIAKDGLNTFVTSVSSPTPFLVTLPIETIAWEDIFPLIAVVAILPLVLAFAIASVRRRRHRKISVKKQKEKEIAQRFSDVLSIRSIICRNSFGLPFYTENFVTESHNLDLTAGLTSAISNIVTEVSQREMKKGEFDVLEREGFSILSHHGEYSTISIVSEGRLSKFMKEKVKKLNEAIESRFNQQELEDPSLGEIPEEFRGLVYKYLNVGLLSKLTINFNRFKEKEKQFTDSERKYMKYLQEILPKSDSQIAFYVTTFTSTLTKSGVSLVKAYILLEKSFRLRIIYPIVLEPRIV
ncbi:MAG: carboxypeptidase-like regulatory domain-containing protein [Candidatus Hermodarchaeota archaeon]